MGGLWRQVLCCNFHSHEATKPGTLSPDDFVGVIDDILASLGRSSCVLMGKSWGGRNAVAYAAARPEAVSRLVLSAPAFGMEAADAATLRKLTMPTLLGWSEDVSRTIVAETFILVAAFSKDPQQQPCGQDTVIPFATHRAYRENCADLHFCSYKTGGHQIVAELLPDLLSFLGKPRAKV